MAFDPGIAPQAFELTPSGPRVSPNAVHLLAEAKGLLVGAVVDGMVRTRLARPDRRLVLLMWPDGFAARSAASRPVRGA